MGVLKNKSFLIVAAGLAVLGVVILGAVLIIQSLSLIGSPDASATSPDRTSQPAPPAPAPTVAPPTPTPTPTPTLQTPIMGTVVTAKGANIRSGPTSGSERLGGLVFNAQVIIECFARGETVSDALGTTDVWYRVPGGYMSAAILMPDGSRTVPAC